MRSHGSLSAEGFRHFAAFYSGEAEFVARTIPFIRGAVEAEHPIMVAVGQKKGEHLQSTFGSNDEAVRFIDMEALGRNPARIIPAWQEFVEEHRGQAVRGIGEPAWPGRTREELTECEHHEHLLNLAFEDAHEFELMCPYDVEVLDPAVIDGARRTHPALADGNGRHRSADYLDPGRAPSPFGEALPEPATAPEEMTFERKADLRAVRGFVAAQAAAAGLRDDRRRDLVLAVSELATNGLRHGPGAGVIRTWREDSGILCEVEGAGVIADPLAGRHCPTLSQMYGWGLYVVHQACDLVRIHSGNGRTAVRVQMALD